MTEIIGIGEVPFSEQKEVEKNVDPIKKVKDTLLATRKVFQFFDADTKDLNSDLEAVIESRDSLCKFADKIPDSNKILRNDAFKVVGQLDLFLAEGQENVVGKKVIIGNYMKNRDGVTTISHRISESLYELCVDHGLIEKRQFIVPKSQ